MIDKLTDTLHIVQQGGGTVFLTPVIQKHPEEGEGPLKMRGGSLYHSCHGASFLAFPAVDGESQHRLA